MKCLVFDVETSGLRLPEVANPSAQPRIIELGAIAIDSRTKIGEYSQLVFPGFVISAEITKITGIKADDLKGKPVFRDVLPALKAFFEGTDLLIAHNALFDYDMLTHEVNVAGCEDFPWPKDVICTAQEYQPVFGFNPTMKQIYERVIGVPLEQTHRALDDVQALLAIIEKDDFLTRLGY